MLLMLFIRKEEDYKLPHKKLVFYLTTAASIIVAFIVFPMDLLYNKFVSEKEHVNTVAFEEAKANAVFYNKLIIDDLHKNDSIVYREDSVSWDMNSGRYIMNIVASGCEFCKLGMKKVNMIFENNGIDKSRYKLAIWGTPITVSLFIKETEALDYDYHLISPVDAIDIVYGVFPTFLWVEDGKVVKAGNFREINENDIVDFLSKEE